MATRPELPGFMPRVPQRGRRGNSSGFLHGKMEDFTTKNGGFHHEKIGFIWKIWRISARKMGALPMRFAHVGELHGDLE